MFGVIFFFFTIL